MPAKSDIWLHFERVKEKNLARCRHCGNNLKTSGNTTNLRCHLEHKHPIVLKAHPKSAVQQAAETSGVRKTKRLLSPAPSTSTSSIKRVHNVHTKVIDDDDSESELFYPESPSNANTPSTFMQGKIDEAFAKIDSFKHGDISSKITHAIVQMICVDAEPISIVEHSGFRNLMKTVAPLYVVPSRKTIRTAVIDKYNFVSAILKAELKNVPSYCFTTDIWTDSQNRSFLSFTVHYCNISTTNHGLTGSEKNIEKAALGLFDLHDRHTAQYIAEQFDRICEEWDIVKEKTTAVVTDSAANIVKAVEIGFGKKSIPCFAHTLNLLATKGIENVPELVVLLKTVKGIVSWFHQSVTASDELRKVTNRKLVQDVATRWNSTYDMLKRFLELRPFINDIVNRITTAPPMTSALEIEILHDVIDVLGPLRTATLEISSNQYMTSSLAIPIVCSLLEEINATTPKHDIGKGLKESILTQHKKRFGSIEHVHLLAVSTLLDPRFKREYFQDKLACAKAVSAVSKMMEVVSSSHQAGSPERHDSPSSEDSDKERNSLFRHHNKKIQNTWQRKTRRDEAMPAELSLYLNAPNEKIEQQPLGFWKAMRSTYPTISEVVFKNIPIVATSVPSERLFSQAGLILSSLRNRLSEELASKLLFLHEAEERFWK